MLKFFDRLLTFAIDQLYLQRTKLRIRVAIAEAKAAENYKYPNHIEIIDRRLQEFGLSLVELHKTTSQTYASNIDAQIN